MMRQRNICREINHIYACATRAAVAALRNTQLEVSSTRFAAGFFFVSGPFCGGLFAPQANFGGTFSSPQACKLLGHFRRSRFFLVPFRMLRRRQFWGGHSSLFFTLVARVGSFSAEVW